MARRSPACRCNSTWATGRRHQRPDRHPCGARSGVCRDVRLFGASWRLSGRKLDEPKGLARDELSLKLADVAYWRYSDLPRCLLFDRFRKQSGHQGALRVTRLFHIPRNGLGSALSGSLAPTVIMQTRPHGQQRRALFFAVRSVGDGRLLCRFRPTFSDRLNGSAIHIH